MLQLIRRLSQHTMKLKKRVGATVYLNNIVINISRLLLGLFVIAILFSLIWSGGSLAIAEYFLSLSLMVISIYAVYVSGKSASERKVKSDNPLFIFGFVIFLLKIIINIADAFSVSRILFLLIMMILFFICFKLKTNSK